MEVKSSCTPLKSHCWLPTEKLHLHFCPYLIIDSLFILQLKCFLPEIPASHISSSAVSHASLRLSSKGSLSLWTCSSSSPRGMLHTAASTYEEPQGLASNHGCGFINGAFEAANLHTQTLQECLANCLEIWAVQCCEWECFSLDM